MGRRKAETSQLIKTKKTLTKVFNQRKDGIMKKAFELSTLCDVQVGVIIYGPNGDSPVVWPKDSDSLPNIWRRYQKTSVEERRKRAMDMSCFVKESDNFTAQRNNEVNVKPEIDPLLCDKMFDNLSIEQLMDSVCSLDNKIEAVKAKIDVLKNNQINALQSDYGGGVQQLSDVFHLPELPCADALPVNDHYFQLLERQVYEENQLAKNRYEDDMRMMMMMMMMNGENYCSNFNDNKVDVGDYFNGFMEGNFNGAMVDQFSLTSPCCNPFSLMPEQAQYDGVQLPLNYNNLLYF